MVHHCCFLFILLFISVSGFGQDERYYRQILTGELPRLNLEAGEAAIAQFNVMGAQYKVDLDGDGIEEIIQPQKRDGVDWLEIRNSSQSKLFEAKLLAMGAGSYIYKLRLVQISAKVRALLIFLDEGVTAGKRFESTGRFFVLSFENNDLSKMTLTDGPHFYHEKEAQREQYWRRDYAVNVYDIDGDGSREIAVQYNHIQRIMKYLGRGEWQRL
ncbi:MAG: hypothetical protein NDI69_13550 [Bacteriovoracaceae bacterium]|nr:hypothetical protein [Bacteriovoracaceae bacterium]